MFHRIHIGYWPVLLAMIGLATVYTVKRDLYGQYLQYKESERRTHFLRVQLDNLQREGQALQRRVEHLGNDPVEIEAAIRRSKDLVRAGEKIYRIELPPE